MNATDSKLYRFAVYGLSGSGKTCLLTALTMPRIPHPDGLSCTWLREPPGVTDKEAESYQRGRTALEECQNEMLQGKQPKATSPRLGFPPLRFNFTVQRPCPRTYPVELRDYAGELIDSRTRSGELVSELREHIRLGKVDAVLILAEVPRPGPETAKFSVEFAFLKQAFGKLRDEGAGSPVQRVPVALLLNKWDRRHPATDATCDRQRELDEFLNSQRPPPHADLINFLHGSVAEGCFRPFAVSAFGVARSGHASDGEGTTVTDAELPPLRETLPSFGLEDAFVWAARQRDALDAAALKQETKALALASKPYLWLNSVVFWRPWGLWRRARDLTHRYSNDAGELPPLRAAQWRAAWITVGRTLLASVTSLVLLAALVLFAVSMLNNSRWREIQSNLTRPERTPEVAAKDEQWLEEYITSPGYHRVLSRLSFSRAEAAQVLEESRDRREHDAWAKVAAASDDLARDEPAAAYLNSYPNGKHAIEAKQIRQRAADALTLRENQDHLDAVRRDFKDLAARDTMNQDKLKLLDQKLKNVPHPSRETKEQHAVRKKLQEEIGDALCKAGVQERQARYQSLLDEGHVREAGRLLAAWNDAPKELIQDFPRKAMARIERDYTDHVEHNRFRDADDVTQQLDGDGDLVKKLLTADDLNKLESWRANIAKAKDRHLYEKLRSGKSLDRAEEYLAQAAQPTMKKQVEAYKEHLLKLRQKLPLTLSLSKIEWGNAWDRDTDYTVTLNGETAMEGKVHAANNSENKDVDKKDITFKLDDSVTLGIRVKHIGRLKDTDYGSPSQECTVRQLDGVKLTLDGKDPPSYVYFTLQGIPSEPELPPYRED